MFRHLLYSGVNRFYSNYPSDDSSSSDSYLPFLTYTVQILSSNLWSSELILTQKRIYFSIKHLRNKGFTYNQISDSFNKLGIKSVRDKKFTYSLVWSLEKRMNSLLDRLTGCYQPVIKDVDITLESVEDEEKESFS